MSESFEKLGLFYLGRHVDAATRQVTDRPLVYEANDLVTHAAIIGMTGSGKTGLGIALLEEAAMDGVPVLAIDPKGDLGNLLLTFPQLTASSFEQWVSAEDGRAAGASVTELAASEAERWKKGLEQWGQDEQRIARLRAAADFAIYTPGSSAGTPISILKSFAPPAANVIGDAELLAERVSTAATSLLSMAGLDADPMRSREHVLVSTLLQQAWQQGRALDLPALIGAVQDPGIAKIGVLELEAFYPASDRFALAMRLNHLVAAPDFAVWLQGEPLDMNALLYTPQGKPRVSVVTISPLDDRERMFFVSLLLNELVGWVRAQRGTSSLRALVYFDEVLGFLPPVANPPSKPPILALRKQARAFGVGLVLATQNPVDLDYKALSNTGTWFLGRLQTQRDKDRLLDGLEGVAAGHLDRAEADGLLSSLEKRVFLMHNVHDERPVLFQTRWTMAYLRGPLGREEIARLTPRGVPGVPTVPGVPGVLGAQAPGAQVPGAPEVPSAPDAPATQASSGSDAESPPRIPSTTSTGTPSTRTRGTLGTSGTLGTLGGAAAPVLDPAIAQFFARGDGSNYAPVLLGAARIVYSDAKLGVDDTRDIAVTTPIGDGAVAVDWEHAEPATFSVADLSRQPLAPLGFAALPRAATQAKKFALWQRDFAKWAALSQSIELLRSDRAKLTSHPDEDERDFRIRVQAALREARDAAVEKARRKYASKLAAAEEKLRRAEAVVDREQQQASESKVQAGVSLVATIAGAFLGRKAVSATTLGRATTAARGVGRVGRESQDVTRAEANLAALREARDHLAADVASEMQQVAATFDSASEAFSRVLVKPKRGSVSVQVVALVWVPTP
jgi:Helicase HerA, central domain